MKILIQLSSLIFFTFSLNVNLQAQNNPDHKRTFHWYFGDKIGLDFSSGTPVVDTNGQMTVLEGNATISDTNGNLLFYTNGKTVWNRNHVIMMNGTGLGVGLVSSPRDCAVIIPSPSSDNNIYYIFTVDGWENQFQNGLRYHVVDMTQDNGKGAVVLKNIQLFAPCAEQLAATKDSSGCGYWVAIHELHTANFRTYHITSAGIDTVPVISAGGIDYSVPQQYYNLSGGLGLKFTPDGNLAGSFVAYTWIVTDSSDYMDILKFNKGSGKFSSITSIPLDSTLCGYGFSPNSQVLYAEAGQWAVKLYQYDLSSLDSTLICNSKTALYTSPNGIGQDYQIGHDGKVYICCEIPGKHFLSVIHNPNSLGTACGVQYNALGLYGRQPEQQFTRFVSNFLINDSSSICTVNGIHESDNEIDLLLYPNPADEIINIESNIKIKQIKLTNVMDMTILEDSNFINKSSINCQPLANGIYIIQLKTINNKTFSAKLIINH
jgi:large repetitive protein